ncbi:glycosyltransferase family 61 protein [Nocardioides mangrovicus]|uniref:Glycosyltransferase family 61 protein n=1 Tax=Nocardioides mangrovicus TaxID=2478913 RepID=A0A3L8P046_9ACTN|nr:glycosyltransferase family 61 protein [Nocardioides mangrovicus]RLV48554.1 glycosyltransferase family 61 protein [Nocardioides mangrovicus]
MANIGWAYLLRRGLQHHARFGLRERLRRLRRREDRPAPAPTTSSERLAAQGRATRRSIHPAEPVGMLRPAEFSDAQWAAFTIRDVDVLPEQFVLDLPHARVQGKYGWVYTDASPPELVSDLWQEAGFPSRSMAGAPPTGSPARRLEGTTASLLLPWMPNYYHWTLQAVPMVDMTTRVVDLHEIDHWLVPSTSTPFVAEWLDRLGIEPRTRVPVEDWTTVIELDRLVVCSVPARNRYIPDWVVADIRRRLPAAGGAGGTRRLFVDRPNSDKRRVINHQAMLELVRDRGFTVVELAGRSVAEQAELFASADVVAGVLGAGLTNIVYCRPGTRLVEILPRNLLFPAYYKLAASCGLTYSCVQGTEPHLPGRWRFPDTEADLVVDLDALGRQLDDAAHTTNPA